MPNLITVASDFEPPTMSDFFPKEILFAHTPFAIDRLILVRFILTALLLVIVCVGASRASIVPRGLQNIVEIVIDFVQVHIGEEILGKKYARTYLPILATTFLLVLFLNISSVIPFLNISSNARVSMPLVLSVFAYVIYIAVGVKHNGWGYFRDSIIVKDVPWPLHFLLIPIEFISTFILRPFTLTVRLMANMLAGHMMLALFFAATDFFFFHTHIVWMKSLGLGSFAFAFLFVIFEILVAFLQAYIFALLVAVYIDSSLHVSEH